MTTRLREKEKEKCFQYWNLNEGEVAVFGNFEIATVLVDDSNGFTVTSMEVTNLKVKKRF